MAITTRFAPSPTGFLHLGHAYAAHTAWVRAKAAGGQFLLRLEDIDSTRCRPSFSAAIMEDLQWLGLPWDGQVRAQSTHLAQYELALAHLRGRGLLYPCFCSRSEIASAQSAPHGNSGLYTALYPGTCRNLSPAACAEKLASGAKHAWRLHLGYALAQARNLRFHEEKSGWHEATPQLLGDVVLARADVPTSYHLCVVHDDALQNITLVTRGEDLFQSTHIHVLLQKLLGLPTPAYAHHRLLVDANGHRLAKRAAALSLRTLRAAGHTPEQIKQHFTQQDQTA